MLKVLDQSPAIHNAALIYGNTLRLGILHLLHQGSFSRSELSKKLGVSEANMSRQIQFLSNEGLIITTVLPGRGRPTKYSLQKENAKNLERIFLSYLHGEDSA